MRNKRIFEVGEKVVRAVRFEASDGIVDRVVYPEVEDEAEVASKDEYEKAMDRWADPDYLHYHFMLHQKDLREGYPFMKVRTAVNISLDQAGLLSDRFLALSESGDEAGLEEMFKPLHNAELGLPTYMGQKFKAKGPESTSWLRIYALRYGNLYLITGSAIKLTSDMNTRPHLQSELHKLDVAAKHFNSGTSQGVQVYLDTYGYE
jgi:hypothetical protein